MNPSSPMPSDSPFQVTAPAELLSPAGPAVAPRDAAVFLTHHWSPSIAQHYDRLLRETAGLLDVFLVFNIADRGAEAPPGVDPSAIVLSFADSADLFPSRHAEYLEKQSHDPWGYIDLAWMPALCHPRLAGYDRCWVLEYDVDFSGHWADFFRPAVGFGGDLLAAMIRPRSEHPTWENWVTFRQPAGAPADALICFGPIIRLSRRLITAYGAALKDPGWRGHFEALLPSVAQAAGLDVADVGGEGRFTPAGRQGHFYHGRWPDLDVPLSTHGFRPVRGLSYYEQAPDSFPLANRIYHPIKTDLPGWRRFRHRLSRGKRAVFDLLSRWVGSPVVLGRHPAGRPR